MKSLHLLFVIFYALDDICEMTFFLSRIFMSYHSDVFSSIVPCYFDYLIILYVCFPFLIFPEFVRTFVTFIEILQTEVLFIFIVESLTTELVTYF